MLQLQPGKNVICHWFQSRYRGCALHEYYYYHLIKIHRVYESDSYYSVSLTCFAFFITVQMAVSGANLHNVFMLLTMEPLLARNPFLVLHVRRNHLVSDALRELTVYNDVDLKKPLKVCLCHPIAQCTEFIFF